MLLTLLFLNPPKLGFCFIVIFSAGCFHPLISGNESLIGGKLRGPRVFGDFELQLFLDAGTGGTFRLAGLGGNCGLAGTVDKLNSSTELASVSPEDVE